MSGTSRCFFSGWEKTKRETNKAFTQTESWRWQGAVGVSPYIRLFYQAKRVKPHTNGETTVSLHILRDVTGVGI